MRDFPLTAARQGRFAGPPSSAGQAAGGGAPQTAGGPPGPIQRLLLLNRGQFGWALGSTGVDGLEPHQLPSSTQHHLAEFLEPALQFPQHLLGVMVGPFLNRGGLMAGSGDQCFALLLGLLAELERIVVEPLRLGLAVTLDPVALLADRFELSQCLLPTAFVLFEQLAVPLAGFLIEVLAPRLGFLLQLLAPGGELLLHLGQAGLEVLLRLGSLLPGGKNQLLPLLAGLLAHLAALALRLLTHGGGGDQCLPFAPGLTENLLGLVAGLLDEALPLAQQILGLGNLVGQGGAEGVHRFDGVLLIHQTSATEGDAAAFENDVLELIELVENGDARLAHVIRELMAD